MLVLVRLSLVRFGLATSGGETEGFHFANQWKSIAGEVRLVKVR